MLRVLLEPCVVSLVHQLGKEFKHALHHIIIGVKCVQRAFDDHAEILGVNPVPEPLEVVTPAEPLEYTCQDVEELLDLDWIGRRIREEALN